VEHPDKQRFLRELIRDDRVCFLGLSETIKSQYTRKIAGNRNFSWKSVPPIGRSGGMLLGVDSDLHDILEEECGKYHIRMHLLDKYSKMKWHLIVVYGPAQSEGKEGFLTQQM
jgi:hypothetical protein